MIDHIGSLVLIMLLFTLWPQIDATVAVEHQTQTIPKKGIVLDVISFEVSQAQLNLRYRVRNDSDHDVWICDDVDIDSPVDFETVASLEGSDLIVRLRLGIPMGWWRLMPPTGRYIRLASGKDVIASLRLTLPVRQQPLFTSRSAHHGEQREQADRLVLEVGYIPGDLPGKITSLVRDANEVQRRWRAEEDALSRDENRLVHDRVELAKRLQKAVESSEKERLQRELDGLEAQQERFVDAWASLNRTALYLKTLGLEVPLVLVMDFESLGADLRQTQDALAIPHEYTQSVEKERFLRCIVEDVHVAYLPPRYLDWGQVEPAPKIQVKEDQK